ncbi:hypothetical protein [Dyadobacter arcticus]|uniref:Uncharacterized protein n=1 Tax=Dyadobacter arcticus TaxID=1078754 RepID=A0ABX0UFM5_9BACT|nr:hypothetical protein [Dyadobacter arcticus]NIJ51487.1 hypothetical protein [Dyadobacter arcticus]
MKSFGVAVAGLKSGAVKSFDIAVTGLKSGAVKSVAALQLAMPVPAARHIS